MSLPLWSVSLPPHPQYQVNFLSFNKCGCGVTHKEEHTWTYFTPEEALDQAVFLMKSPNHLLVSVDQ